jgi:hypothetical protein
LQFTQISDYVRELDSFRAGSGEKLATKLPDSSLPFHPIDKRLLVRQERARPLLREEYFADFKFSIRANDGIRIDRQIDRELANGRQLIARTKLAGRNAAHDLIDNLAVHGYAATLVEGKLERKGHSQVIMY